MSAMRSPRIRITWLFRRFPDFASNNLPARIAKALQVGAHFLGAQNCFSQRQGGVDHIQAAMQAGPPGLQRFHADDLGFYISLPRIRQPAAALLVFVFVAGVHSQESDEPRQHDRVFVRRRKMINAPVLSA